MIIVIILIIFSFSSSSSSSSSSSNDIFLKAYLMYCKSVPAVSVIPVVLGSKYNGEELTVSDCFKEYIKDPSTTGMTDTAGTDLQYIRYAFRNISLLLLLLLLLLKLKMILYYYFLNGHFPGYIKRNLQ